VISVDEVIVELSRALPSDELPVAIARAAMALRAEGIDVTDRARTIIRQLPSMRAYEPVLITDEERIDELYDRLHRAGSETERTDLLRELRQLQEIEAHRLVAAAESRTSFRPRDAVAAIAEARRLIAQHAAALDDTATKHRD